MKNQDRRLRIIGGKWRGRKVSFPDVENLRPTSDRIRETLFNWLMQEVAGAACLDLFAGSGALSFEALSRGAASVTLVEKDAGVVRALDASLGELEADRASFTLVQADATDWLAHCDASFDIIFLDPPFLDDRLPGVISQVALTKIARKWVYIESGNAITPEMLPEAWRIHRQKRAGAVHYCLCDSS
jgi:16S rRNA (guanine966-N2)-methyltransferase